MYRHKISSVRGVTLIELLVVMIIASILAALAIPTLGELISRTRQTSVLGQLSTDLSRARSEAIKRNMRVLVCVRGNDTTCGTSSSNWRNGWLVCFDADSNDACDTTTTSNPNPIVVKQQISNSITLVGPSSVIRFYPSGINGSGAVSFTVGGTWTGAQNKIINIAATGNITKP